MQIACKQTPTGTIWSCNTYGWLSLGAKIVNIFKTQQSQTPSNRILVQVYREKKKHVMFYMINNMERLKWFFLSLFPSPFLSFTMSAKERERLMIQTSGLKTHLSSPYTRSTWFQFRMFLIFTFIGMILPLIEKHVCLYAHTRGCLSSL